MTKKFIVEIADLSAEGVELPDEQLLAIRGGILGQTLTTCHTNGSEDVDTTIF